MRIISGLARGVPLAAPAGNAVRPTSDRVKESLFSALGDIRGWVVADLFAGSGALGLEALSRGARLVLAVEREPRPAACIRDNLERVRHAAAGAGASRDLGEHRLVTGDVRAVPRLLAEYAGRLDLVLADPPYHPGNDGFGAGELLRDHALAAWIADALLVLEHAADTALPWTPNSPWRLLRQRRFGIRCLAFCRRAGDNTAAAPACTRAADKPGPRGGVLQPMHAKREPPVRPNTEPAFSARATVVDADRRR